MSANKERRSRPVEFNEGKQAKDNFLQAMQKIIRAPKHPQKKRRAA